MTKVRCLAGRMVSEFLDRNNMASLEERMASTDLADGPDSLRKNYIEATVRSLVLGCLLVGIQ